MGNKIFPSFLFISARFSATKQKLFEFIHPKKFSLRFFQKSNDVKPTHLRKQSDQTCSKIMKPIFQQIHHKPRKASNLEPIKSKANPLHFITYPHQHHAQNSQIHERKKNQNFIHKNRSFNHDIPPLMWIKMVDEGMYGSKSKKL